MSEGAFIVKDETFLCGFSVHYAHGVHSLYMVLNADNKSKHWGTWGNARWFDLFQHYSAAGRYKDIIDGGTQNVKNESSLTKWKPDHAYMDSVR